MRQIYLDYAAATPMDKRVLAAMMPYFSEQFYNPSALYEPALRVRQALAEARASVAHWLGARPTEIIFTAGGTEANNLAIHGIMQRYPEANIVVSAIEHDAVREPARRYDCREVAVDTQGNIDLDALERAIDDKTVLVSIMYANNEIGTIEPLREIAKIIGQKRRTRSIPRHKRQTTSDKPSLPLYFHTDACQAGNYLDLHAARVGIDMMTLNGGKLYGPKQSGALYVKSGVELVPLIRGGGQERGLRSGTENIAATIGFAQALTIAQTMRHEEAHRLQALQTMFMQQLEMKLPGACINGSRKKRLPNNVHVTLPGTDNERLLVELEQRGVLASAGSACSASSAEASHVLQALGRGEAEARASLRFSMGRGTDAPAVDRSIDTLMDIMTKHQVTITK